jgi:uncharacterized membrane protein SpoIIM required for sporulation
MTQEEQKEWDEFNNRILRFLFFGFGFVFGTIFYSIMLKYYK